MKTTQKSTAGVKPASPRRIRAALEKFLSSDQADRQMAGGRVLSAIASRLPEALKPPATEKRPDLSELPVPPERRDRAVFHLQEAIYVLSALRDIGFNGQDVNIKEPEIVVQHLATRGKTLVLAALAALDEATIDDLTDEFATELDRYKRRRDGKPEQEPEAEPSA